jgi:hypothetical protein
MTRVICWFSCGAASAVATKLALSQYRDDEVVIARCRIDEEHQDNDRFAADCEKWFGRSITVLSHPRFGSSIENVFAIRRYMSGIHGAPCTYHLKKQVREAFERPADLHVFGYTCDKEDWTRWDAFLDANNIAAVAPLIERMLTHADTLAMIEDAGIVLPAMYKLGYQHNNCIGCVKATGAGYWNKVRKDFPLVFQRRAEQSRELGCKLVKLDDERIYLDELKPNTGRYNDEPEIQCGIFCEMAKQEY